MRHKRRRCKAGKAAAFARLGSQSGLAIIIVLFVVALASIIVVNVSYSTFIQSRTIGMVERQLQAEYALKSLVNFSLALISEDTTPNVDSFKDAWAMFRDGMEVPHELVASLGINDPGMRVYLEITPDNSMLSLKGLSSENFPHTPNPTWAEPLKRLFENLGFDDKDRFAEEDQSGLFPGTVFNSEQLVLTLIQYASNDINYRLATFSEDGIGPKLPDPDLFPHRPIERIEELITIPGFTPNRIRQLEGNVTAYEAGKVNINTAGPKVISALHQDLSDNDGALANEIIGERDGNNGPFNSPSDIRTRVPSVSGDAMNALLNLCVAKSPLFQVIAKVEYGNQASYFMKAHVHKPEPNDPDPRPIRYPVLY